MTRVIGERSVVEYRWRFLDFTWRITAHNYYTDEEAADLFKGRPHERIDETRRAGRRQILPDDERPERRD